jgi:anti-sigma regulatory factor (Ser/Thr protein kinase)
VTKHRRFPNTVGAVTSARRFVRQTLAGTAPDVVDDVALMVSELATNCVRHAASPFVVLIDQSAHDIRIEVADDGGGEPVMRTLRPTKGGGVGLHIVQALADAWGVIPASGTGGKVVWFTLALPHPSGELQQP